jgi:TonB-linked SusC/RagA family outer membrane protein
LLLNYFNDKLKPNQLFMRQFIMKRILLTTFGVMGICAITFAQTRQLSGKVTSQDKQGVVSATVKVKSAKNATTTNADGVFSFNVPAGQLVLEVSSVGFVTKDVQVAANQNTVDVVLTAQVGELADVVVTALGIKKDRKALGYALTEVKGDELTRARTNSVVSNLVGKVAGLNVAATATGAGGSTRVVLRGNTSISDNNQPLYVIDGVPLDNQNRGSAGMWGGSDAGDGIQMINPDEIESLSVLKGGNAAALYGARASAGVILITTKKGSSRKGLGIEINSNATVESVLDFTDYQYQYGQGSMGNKPATQADAQSLNSWGAKLDNSSVIQWDGVSRPYTAKKNNIKNFYKDGTNISNSVSFYGGTDKSTYNFSMSDMDNKSVIPNSTLKRNNFSLNLGMNPVDNLSINVSARYLRERTRNRPRLSDSPGNANFTIGLIPTSWDESTFSTSKLDPLTGGENKFNGNDYVTNPYWSVENFKNNDSRDRLIASIESRYNISEAIYVRGRIATDQYTRASFGMEPQNTRYTLGGSMFRATDRFREFNAELIVGVKKELTSKINLDAIVGGNMMQNIDETQRYSGNNLLVPGFYHINNMKDKGTDYYYSEKRIQSAFGSAELSYNNYLFVTVTGRNDWYSTLSPENRSILYPSVAVSYILSQAVKLPEFVNYAKVRGSWAEVGGDRSPYGLSLPYSLASNTFSGLGVGSIGTGTIPNKGLLPYKVTSTELGLEAKLFNNKLGIDFSIYDKKTTNDIISSQISGTSGYGSVLINVGEVSNKGVELLLTATPYKASNLTWNVSLNMGYNESKVVKISDQLTSLNLDQARYMDASIQHITGKAFGQIMAYDFKRNAAGKILLNAGKAQRGNLVEMGSGVSPLTMGLNNSFSFGDFNFEFLIDGKFGGYIYSGTNAFGMYRGKTAETLPGREGGIVADGIDEATGLKNTVNINTHDYYQSIALSISTPFVYKSDFIKLRQVIFSYNVPSKMMAKSPFKGASVSVVGRNLLMIMKNTPNIDPESTYNSGNAQGLEYYGAPSVRSFGINLNLKF